MKYRNLITKISNLAVLAHIPFGHVPNRKGWKGKSLTKPSYLGDIKKNYSKSDQNLWSFKR